MAVTTNPATSQRKLVQTPEKPSLLLCFAGKWQFTGYDGLRYWVYSAVDNDGRGLFRPNTTWGISFDGLPKHWVMNPRLAMPGLLELDEHAQYLADEVDSPLENSSGMPVIPRMIKETADKNRFDIAFIATPEESTEPLLLGVNLEIFDEDDRVFRTVMRSTLLGPKLVESNP